MEQRTKQRRKADHQRAVRLNITLPPALYDGLADLVRKHAYAGPAEYIQARIRKDAGLELAA